MEVWTTIDRVGNGLYVISNIGRVRSFTSKSNGAIIKQVISSNGYPLINIYTNGKRWPELIHRLVAEAFIPNPDNKPCVNHKNGIKSDNRIENLEWTTYSENSLHAFKILGRKGSAFGRFGKDHHSSVPVIQLSKDDTVIKEWDSMADAQREFNIDIKNISAVCRNKRRLAGGFKWKYKNVS